MSLRTGGKRLRDGNVQNGSCDDCAGSCSADYDDCNDDFVQDGCETDLTTDEDCGACDNACQQDDFCYAAECSLYAVYGHGSESNGSLAISPNYVFSLPVTLDNDAWVTELGVFVKAAGPNAKLALYKDNGADNPGALVVASAGQALVLGENVYDVQDTQVTAGKYWIAMMNDQTVSMAQDNNTYCIRFYSLAYANPFPDPHPVPSCANAGTWDLYVRVIEPA